MSGGCDRLPRKRGMRRLGGSRMGKREVVEARVVRCRRICVGRWSGLSARLIPLAGIPCDFAERPPDASELAAPALFRKGWEAFGHIFSSSMQALVPFLT